jgi:uncharacterized membrane protein
MATETPTPGGASTNLGLEPKIAGLLCYVPCCIGLIFSVVAAIVEKQSRFVRFHAFQSLLLQGGAVVVLIGLQIAAAIITSIGVWVLSGLIWIVQILVGVALLGVLIVLMIKANSGEEMALPVIGPMARQWA